MEKDQGLNFRQLRAFPSIRLSFLICRMGMIMAPAYQGCENETTEREH